MSDSTTVAVRALIVLWRERAQLAGQIPDGQGATVLALVYRTCAEELELLLPQEPSDA